MFRHNTNKDRWSNNTSSVKLNRWEVSRVVRDEIVSMNSLGAL
jgi:hypothetical protein